MKQFLKIGQAAKLCNTTIKALRFYEEKGLITPVEVDAYTGYRHYDEQNLQEIYKIQFLKSVGFSLDEIKDFDENSLDQKVENLKKQLEDIRKKISIISSTKITKGEKKMKPFINDEKAIGKWTYVASCSNKKEFEEGQFFVDKDIDLQQLYFLPNGEGYWIFQRWTKGEIFAKNRIWTYQIEKNKLFLDVAGEICLVYKKNDAKTYSENEIALKDDVNLPFVKDEKVQGFWKVYDLISYEDKATYDGKKQAAEFELWLKTLIFMPNGDLICERIDGTLHKLCYTKSAIINGRDNLVMNYEIRKISGKEFLIFDWKSGDYKYGNKIKACYVFEQDK